MGRPGGGFTYFEAFDTGSPGGGPGFLLTFDTGRPGGGFTYFEAFDKDEPGREREFPEASHAGELPSRLNGSRCSGSEGERLSGGTGFAFGEYGIDLMGICENIDKFLKNNSPVSD